MLLYFFLCVHRNGYYGGASASLNLKQLFEKYKGGAEPPAALGQSRDYNVDIVPKFIMASGGLVSMLIHTDVKRYLEFRSIAGSYVFRGGKIHKVPATDADALKSPLMSFFEKRRCAKFLQYVCEYEDDKPATHGGLDLTKVTMEDLYKKYSLESDTIDFIGHALALYRDEAYIKQPALETVHKVRMYLESLARYSKSPYIYPLYGLGELPQGFARLSAIHGGTYMLNAPIEKFVYDEAGAVVGVQSTEEGHPVAKCKFVVGDPSYFPDRVKKVGSVVRLICILSHPIDGTDGAESCQIIVPQNQVKRKSDIYICAMSSANMVCPKGKWIAIVASTVETEDPVAELAPAVKLLGQIDEQFVSITDLNEPLDDGKASKVFISKSLDATTHFETTVDDVLDMYERITGKKLVMKTSPSEEEAK